MLATRIRRDTAILAVLFVACVFLAISVDAFDHLFDWSRSWEAYEVDELLVALALLSILLAGFSYRRYTELNAAMQSRKAAEDRLQASEERFRDLVEGSLEGIMVTVGAKTVFANNALADMLGYSIEELLGMNSWERLVVPEDKKQVIDVCTARMLGHTAPARYEYRALRKDGSIIWLENLSRAVRWNGEDAVQATVVDITERNRATAALKMNEDRFRDFAAAGSDYFWETNADFRFSFVSDDYEEIAGIPPSYVIGKSRAELWPEFAADPAFDQSAAWLELQADLAARRPFSGSRFDWRRPDGDIRALILSGVPVFDADGEFQGYRGAATDATARIEAESAARLLADAIEELNVNLLLFDAEDRLVICNQMSRELNRDVEDYLLPGVTFEDHIRAIVARGLAPDAVGREEEWIAKRLERHRNPQAPFEIRRQDGIWFLMHEERLPDGSTVTIATDITQRKAIDEALRLSEERFRALLDNAPPSIYLKDLDGRYLLVNQSMADRFSTTAEEMRGKTVEDLAPPEISAAYAAQDEAVLRTREARTLEIDISYPNGIVRTVSTVKFPVFGSDGEPVALGALTSDISDRMRAENALRDSEERHRQFAADVAHELRTPLAVLRSNLDGLADEDVVRSLRQDVDSMARLVEQLLAIARLDFLAVTPGNEIDLRTVCTNVATHLAPLVVKEQRLIEVTGSQNPVVVRGNGDALEQAVRNLVENAVRYSDPGTTVTIEIRADATVRIIDRGKGISRNIREKVFQRFERADQKGGGAGLGLAIVKRTMEAHEGTITIDDNPAGGAIFTIRFPADRRVPTPPLRLLHEA